MISRAFKVLFAPPFLVSAAFAQTHPADRTENVFLAYVYRAPTNINFRLYTHLAHAFITAEGDGVIRTNSNIPSPALVSAAHQNKVKILLSVGGWGWDKQFAAIVSNSAAEERYTRSIIALVDHFDYDGIDLDWEYPDTVKEVEGFSRLCRTFRKDLDALGRKKNRKMLETMAASATDRTIDWLPKDVLLETIDWINVMTYDMAGEWTDYAGHHAPLFASSKQPGSPRSCELSINHFLERGFPTERLVLGLPLYGKGFNVAEPYASTEATKNQDRPPGGSYSKILELQKEHGWTREWNQETQTPWLRAPDHSAVIGYDDSQSIALKTDWAKTKHLRGVFFWEISGDRLADGSNPLQEVSRQKLIP